MGETWAPAAVVLLLLVGCGGPGASPESTARFIVAADKICSRLPAPLGQSDAGAANTTLASATRVFADQMQRGVARLRRLPLPRGRDRAAAQELIDSLREVGASAARLDVATARLAAHDPTQVSGIGARIEQIAAAATDLNRDVKASNRLGRAFGMQACGRVLQPPSQRATGSSARDRG